MRIIKIKENIYKIKNGRKTYRIKFVYKLNAIICLKFGCVILDGHYLNGLVNNVVFRFMNKATVFVASKN